MISFTILPYLETSKLKCTVQQYLVFPGFFEEINQNGYSYKSKSFKLYEVITSISLAQEKQILRGTLVRKSYCIMIRDYFRNPSNISNRAKSCYLSWQKAP